MSGPNQPEGSRELFQVSLDNASLTADTTVVLDTPTRRFRVVESRYYNATGLVAHAANYFNIKVLLGATVAANWSTETGEEGTIAAATTVSFSAPSDISDSAAAGGTLLSVLYDETGTATLPAGRLVIDCEYY